MSEPAKKKSLVDLAKTVGELYLFGKVPEGLFDQPSEPPPAPADETEAPRGCPAECVRCAGTGEVVVRSRDGQSMIATCPNARPR